MLIDTHVHLLASKTSRPNWDEISYVFHVASEKNIDVLCLTEHRDAVGYEELFIEIFSENRFGGRVEPSGVIQLASGVVISPGAEVSLFGGGDMGVHADLNSVMGLDWRRNEYSPLELVNSLNARGSDYVSVAHHLLLNGKWWVDFEQAIDLVDAIEVPGKQATFMNSYLELASRYSKGQLSGSDAHTWIQLGVGLTFIKKDEVVHRGEVLFDISEFKTLIAKHETVPCVSDAADELIRISKLYKAQSNWMPESGEKR